MSAEPSDAMSAEPSDAMSAEPSDAMSAEASADDGEGAMSGASAAADAYCDKVDEFVAKYKESDLTNVEDAKSLAKTAQELSSEGVKVSKEVAGDSAVAQQVKDCSQELGALSQ
jgi:hypothetical protein